MRSTRTLVFLVCALSISGCKKHDEASAPEAGASDGGTDADTDASDAAIDAGADDAAVPDATPEASVVPETVTTGLSFAGTYDCWGGTMTLTQTGSQITGDAHIPLGTATQTTEVLCTIAGNRCVGQASYFNQKAGHGPKAAGKGKLVFTAQSGGLHYLTLHGGRQEGFCPKK
jgi:hypothetical protein